MAIEQTVVINTDTRSLADLRKEITSIQAELDLTPSGTKEYAELVVKLRQAKGEIKDFKEATKGLDPDQRAAKLVNAFRGMTGAIQAAAGAVTLFGGSSEDLEKVEKNLLGIIAIGGGVQSTIEGFNDAADIIGPKFTQVGNFIKSGFQAGATGAQTFKSALAAIGIGALIAGVTLLVTNFDALKAAITGVNEDLALTDDELKKVGTEAGKDIANLEVLTSTVKDQTQSVDDRKRALSELNTIYEQYGLTQAKDINDTATLTKNLDLLSEALLREAKVRVLKDKLAEKIAENIEDELDLNQQLAQQNAELREFETKAREASAKGDANAFKVNIANKKTNIAETKKELAAINTARKESTATIINLINQEELAINKLVKKKEEETEAEKTAREKKEKEAAAALKAKQDNIEKQNKVDEERAAFVLKLNTDLAKSLENLNIQSAKTEREQLETEFAATFAELERQRKEKVAEAERLGLSILEVNQLYDNLNEAERINYNNAIISLDKKANDKRLADYIASQDALIQIAQQTINEISAATQLSISELDFFYDDILESFQQLTPDEFIELLKTSEVESFVERTTNALKTKYLELQDQENKFAISTRKNILELSEIEIQSVRDRVLKEVQLLESGQVEQIKLYDEEIQLVRNKFAKQKEAALKSGEDLTKITNAEETAVAEVEKRKQASFTQTQVKKKQLLEQGAKTEVDIITRTAEEIRQRNLSLGQFIVDSTAQFNDILATFAQAEGNRRKNAIDDQIKDELKLAKARGASQEELEAITEAGNARLEAEAQRAFKIQQQYAIAAALIDGSSAVLRIFSNAAANPKSILFPAQPYIEAAIAAAFTAAKIAQIKSTSLSGGGGGSFSGGGGSFGSVGGTGGGGNILNPFSAGGFGGGGTNVLPPRLAPKRDPNEFQADATGQFGGTGVTTPIFRTYVLAGDVTDAQVANEKINQKRKL